MQSVHATAPAGALPARGMAHRERPSALRRRVRLVTPAVAQALVESAISRATGHGASTVGSMRSMSVFAHSAGRRGLLRQDNNRHRKSAGPIGKFDVSAAAPGAKDRKPTSRARFWPSRAGGCESGLGSPPWCCVVGVSLSSAGWSSPVARQPHKLEVVGSNPTPATRFCDVASRSLWFGVRCVMCAKSRPSSAGVSRGRVEAATAFHVKRRPVPVFPVSGV